MNPWQHGADIAWVDEGTRRSLMNLERLDQPPIVLEGAALIIHDTIDGTLDTEGLIDELRAAYPDIHTLPEQVRTCLEQLEDAGLIRR